MSANELPYPLCGVLVHDDWDSCKRPAYWHVGGWPDAPYCKQHARSLATSRGADHIWRNKDGASVREVLPMTVDKGSSAPSQGVTE